MLKTRPQTAFLKAFQHLRDFEGHARFGTGLTRIAINEGLECVRTRKPMESLLLERIPELAELCFFVDPLGQAESAANSYAGLRAAHLWVRNGGALVMFPAGEVAHERGPDRCRIESPWRPTAGRIALATGAQVVPAFIAGANTKAFYAAGRVYPALRTALRAREFLHKRGASVAVRLGPALSIREGIGMASDARDASQSIRQAVERLGRRPACLSRVISTGRPTRPPTGTSRPASAGPIPFLEKSRACHETRALSKAARFRCSWPRRAEYLRRSAKSVDCVR